MYAEDIRRDIFNGHQVTGRDLGFYESDFASIFEKVESDPKWRFLLDERLTSYFELDSLDESIVHIKSYFPDANSMIELFNNHARAHRDEQGVDSFRVPIEMIYDEKYEELLVRDMLNDFRITYASDGLGESLVCTFLSKVYWAFKANYNKSLDVADVYRIFELKTSMK